MNGKIIGLIIAIIVAIALISWIPGVLPLLIAAGIAAATRKKSGGKTALSDILSKATDKISDMDASSPDRRPQRERVHNAPQRREPAEPVRGPDIADPRSSRQQRQQQWALDNAPVKINGHLHRQEEDCEHTTGYATAYSDYTNRRGGRSVDPWEMPPEKDPWR